MSDNPRSDVPPTIAELAARSNAPADAGPAGDSSAEAAYSAESRTDGIYVRLFIPYHDLFTTEAPPNNAKLCGCGPGECDPLRGDDKVCAITAKSPLAPHTP